MRARRGVLPTIVLLLSVLCSTACACWLEAAQRYRVPAELLVAIARVESGLNPRAIHHNPAARAKGHGSRDIGLMQINSTHLPRLARWGIQEAQLMDPCTNIHVGAWILAHLFERHGRTWEAVGAYNAACTRLRGEACTQARARYVRKVARYMPRAVQPWVPPSSGERP